MSPDFDYIVVFRLSPSFQFTANLKNHTVLTDRLIKAF